MTPIRAFTLGMAVLAGCHAFAAAGHAQEAIRLSETTRWPEIGLLTPRVSFHPPFTEIETD